MTVRDLKSFLDQFDDDVIVYVDVSDDRVCFIRELYSAEESVMDGKRIAELSV